MKSELHFGREQRIGIRVFALHFVLDVRARLPLVPRASRPLLSPLDAPAHFTTQHPSL